MIKQRCEICKKTLRNHFPLDRLHRTQCTCWVISDQSRRGQESSKGRDRAVNRASNDIYGHSYDITLVNNFVVVVLQM